MLRLTLCLVAAAIGLSGLLPAECDRRGLYRESDSPLPLIQFPHTNARAMRVKDARERA